MKNRTLNGYTLIYSPESAMAMRSKNWHGYVYEHRSVMAGILGRTLLSTEHVHHVDGNRRNNAPDNLRVLSQSEHRRVHAKPAGGEPRRCLVCSAPILKTSKETCSAKCRALRSRRAVRPQLDELVAAVAASSMCAVARRYGVSDNAVKKWLRGR